LEQISTQPDNKVEVIELDCNFMNWVDNKTSLAKWRPLEKVLEKEGFRNNLKEVRVKLSLSTIAPSERSKISVGLMDIFLELRERGVVVSVEDQGPKDYHFMSVDDDVV